MLQALERRKEGNNTPRSCDLPVYAGLSAAVRLGQLQLAMKVRGC
jgi:hypothetical protein